MKIEKAIMLKALKAGNTVWDKGHVFNAPIPEIILTEIRKRTGTVKVLKQGQESKPVRGIKAKSVPVPKKKLKEATTTTTIEAQKEKPKLKPKVKLKLRKKK